MSDKPRTLLDVARMDEDEARAYLESVLWPDGPTCPHCGVIGPHYALKGKKHRAGLYKCRERECRKQFTVTTGTVMHRTHLPLTTWITAFYLVACHKKSISANQLKRDLGIGSDKTAWFLAHRIRKAMELPEDAPPLDGVVAADEAFFDGKRKNMSRSKRARLSPGEAMAKKGKIVVALVNKDGSIRGGVVPDVTADSLKKVLRDVHPSATLVTDGHTGYPPVAAHFAGGHQTVNHDADEYVNAAGFSTNVAESFFALAKRSVYGTYHQVSKQHLHRYVAEWTHRWRHGKSEDADVAAAAMQGAKGRRLSYLAPRGEGA